MSASLADSPSLVADPDRRRISSRVGAGLVAVGILALGSVFVRLQPDQWQLGELMRALAAVVVATPLLASAARGVLTSDPRRAVDQLVAVAVLAAASDRDFTTATLIPLFLEIGRLFEDRTSLGARAAIEGVRALSAPIATRLRGDMEEKVDPATLAVGEVILVRPGERIPVDGTVAAGTSAVDQSPVTGESRPEDVGPGSPVFAGTVNQSGLLRITVKGTGGDTVLGRVVALLASVEQSRLPAVRLMEQRADAFLPLVLALAATTLFFTLDLSRAVAVVVVACPTALVVAGPAAIVAALTAATRKRILVKGAVFLEKTVDVDTLIVDKTGTVTVGAPAISAVEADDGDVDGLLRAAATCAFGSLHPVSRAIVAEARRRELALVAPDSVVEHPGLGVEARVGDRVLRLGRRSFVSKLPDDEGVWLSEGGVLRGRLLHVDPPRPEARAAIDAVRALGVRRVILLTGDRADIARAVADVLGTDEVVADVLPAAKLDVVRREQAAGRVVMMVGDGVNDALALAGADVGVAIGAAINEVALGGADVALLGADLRNVAELMRLADRTRAIVDGNIALGLGFAAALVPLAALGLVDPLTGALLGNLGTLAVVANSARLLADPG